MAFACGVGGIGLDHEVIESRNSFVFRPSIFIHHHRHHHLETAVVVGHERVFDEGFVAFVIAAPPPHCTTAHHLILHTRTLHGHARETAHVAFHRHFVATFVFFRHFVELDAECRTLVFLDREIGASAFRRNGKLTCQTRRGQHKVGGSLAVVVGGDFFLFHHLVIGVAQRQRHLFACQCRSLRVALGLVGDDGGVDGLAWAIQTAVGQHIVGVLRRLVVVKRIISANRLLGTGFVLVGEDEIGSGTHLRKVKDFLALCVGCQRRKTVFSVAVCAV